MIHNMDKYLEILLSSQASVSSLEDALNKINSNHELAEVLDSPNVLPEEKQAVIEELFAPSVAGC